MPIRVFVGFKECVRNFFTRGDCTGGFYFCVPINGHSCGPSVHRSTIPELNLCGN
jgi:hypothetical protein